MSSIKPGDTIIYEATGVMAVVEDRTDAELYVRRLFKDEHGKINEGWTPDNGWRRVG